MRMTNTLIVAAVLGAVFLQGPTRPDAVTAGFRYESAITSESHLGSTGFAQNDPKKLPDNVSTDDPSKTRDDTDRPKATAPEKKVPEEIKPVKPFVPSETIPADQGVDFPYDI